LLAEFKRIRDNDFSIEHGEHVEGLGTIACPIRTSSDPRVIFALGVTGSKERMIRSEASLVPVLRQAANSLGAILATREQG